MVRTPTEPGASGGLGGGGRAAGEAAGNGPREGGGGPAPLPRPPAASAALRAAGRRRLWEAVRRFRLGMGVLAVFTAVRVAATLATPVMLAGAVDAARTQENLGTATARLAFVLALAALADTGEDVLGAYCGSDITAWLRHRLLGRVLALGTQGQRRFPTGDVLARLTESASGPAAFPVLLLTASAALVTTAGALTALALIDWWLAAAFAAGAPPMVVALRVFVVRATEPFARYRRCQAEIATRLLDARRGIRTIRASGTAAAEVRRVLGPLPDLRRAGHETWEAQRRVSRRLAMLAPLTQVLVVGVAGIRLATGDITTGQLVASAAYAAMATASASLFDTFVALLNCQVGAGRVDEVLTAAPAVRPPARPAPPPDGPGRLRLRGVTVRIGDRAVLDGLDLDVPPGAAVAVVGASGTGKSLLVSLVGRLRDPDEGVVEIDGVPVTALALPWVRRTVAYAFERPALLGATVHDTIAYARPESTRAEVRDAARTAAADDFIRALPDGYDTPLADAPLSGGELQRLGLARAALTPARIVVLDDATSSLDTATELKVTRALQRILAGRTSLVVARRPATAARADLVAWLDGGRVRALAAHAELWPDPAYRAVFSASTAEAAGP